MTATRVRSKVCASCRIGQCADCARPLTCKCRLSHDRLIAVPNTVPLPKNAGRNDYRLSNGYDQ